MLIKRLDARCEGVELVCPAVAVADGYALDFSKPSKDGSGKATLREVPGKRSFGVLFKIPEDQRGALDEVEGPGYERKGIDVQRDDGQTVRALFRQEVRLQTQTLPVINSEIAPAEAGPHDGAPTSSNHRRIRGQGL